MELFDRQKKARKRLGYVNDQKGIISRYLRELEGWNPHMKNTQEFILSAADDIGGNSALILGSGWWLDIPVDELIKKYKKVTFVDIAHPRQLQHRAKRYSNLQLIEADINANLMQCVYQLKEITNETVSALRLNTSELTFNTIDFDFVVSVNLLNQLDILIVDYIKKKAKLSENTINKLREKIQQFHSSILPEGKSCLITDYEECTAKNTLEYETGKFDTKPLIYTQLPKAQQKWDWYFDTQKTYYKDKITVMKVMATALF